MLSASVTKKYISKVIAKTDPLLISGKITNVVGMVVESIGPKAAIGELCILIDDYGKEVAKAEIIGFKDNNRILSMVLGELDNISPGMTITALGHSLSVPVGDELLGRVIDGLGNQLDGKAEIHTRLKRSIYASPPSPLLRKRITEPIETGIRSIDGMLTVGKGQRLGIFSGSGVGKSTMIGMIARYTTADVNVIALIGERGREVREFIEKDLGKYGLQRSVVVVATGDKPPLMRIKAALTATTIAEYFRDKGLNVMLMMDSITRLAMAQREVGLSVGEPPTTKGYTPSVFNLMQKTMERSGTADKGSITALYSVLVEGDDLNEPISDTARGILDGHIVLSRNLASMGHYPAIDILESISRLKNDIIDDEHKKASMEIQKLLAAYKNAADLINVGAYQAGANPIIDKAIALKQPIENFLTQNIEESSTFDDTKEQLLNLMSLAK